MKFIVFGEDWGRHPSSTQHLFKHIAEQHEVIWVNSVGMRKPTFTLKDFKRITEKVFKGLFSKTKSQNASNDQQDLIVIEPKLFPWHDNAFIRKVNRWRFKKKLKAYLGNTLEPIIYWISVPTAEYLCELTSKDKLVYYIGDDFSGLAGVDFELVKPFENKLLNEADTIFVCSDTLYKKFNRYQPFLLSHGVDFDLFSEPSASSVNLNKPIIGFYGSINEWFDLKLVEFIAQQRPDYHFQLIGTPHIDISVLENLDNVEHIGAVAHNKLPSYVQHWHIAILPFIDCVQIQACNPLKLREYMASGTPIVTTRYPAAEHYKSTIFIADSYQDFLDKLDNALYLKDVIEAWPAFQRSFVAQESWEHKASSALDELRSVKRDE
ncbi:Glycosyltransferase SypN [Pseudoalteromonas luteoviolacea B = ATCC 29581]|nr:Glycosyltransferase SypN [Pseudoalteromonas luteoviolacea B = ATCC 29581]